MFRQIDLFYKKKQIKKQNDQNNKQREYIIQQLINNQIPLIYFQYSMKWLNLKQNLELFIQKLCEYNQINEIQCIQKAGRNNHYDFQIIINNYHNKKIEFKYNAKSIQNTPQFVSLMKPSNYTDQSYEKLYYEKFFKQRCIDYQLDCPQQEEYIQNIHQSNPECILKHQQKYYQGCKKSSKFSGNQEDIDYYNRCQRDSQQSIEQFVQETNIDIDKLSQKLQQSQQDKIYMLYKDGKIYYEKMNMDDYTIIKQIKDYKFKCQKNSFVVLTKSGNYLQILLRWKNGNGIAFPCFQIKQLKLNTKTQQKIKTQQIVDIQNRDQQKDNQKIIIENAILEDESDSDTELDIIKVQNNRI